MSMSVSGPKVNNPQPTAPVEETKKKKTGDTDDAASSRKDIDIGSYLNGTMNTSTDQLANLVMKGEIDMDAIAQSMLGDVKNMVSQLIKQMFANLFSNDMAQTGQRTAKGQADNTQAKAKQLSVADQTQTAKTKAISDLIKKGQASIGDLSAQVNEALASAQDKQAVGEELIQQSNELAAENAALNEEATGLEEKLKEKYGDSYDPEKLKKGKNGEEGDNVDDLPPGLSEDEDYQRLMEINNTVSVNREQITVFADALEANSVEIQNATEMVNQRTETLVQQGSEVETEITQQTTTEVNDGVQQDVEVTTSGMVTNLTNAADTTMAAAADGTEAGVQESTGSTMTSTPATAAEGQEILSNGTQNQAASGQNGAASAQRMTENTFLNKFGNQLINKMKTQLVNSAIQGISEATGIETQWVQAGVEGIQDGLAASERSSTKAAELRQESEEEQPEEEQPAEA